MKFQFDIPALGVLALGTSLFFFPTVHYSGEKSYVDYPLFFTTMAGGLALSLISGSSFSRLLILLYGLDILFLSILLILRVYTGELGGLDGIIFSFFAGVLVWLSASLIVLRIQSYTPAKKASLIAILAGLSLFSHLILRFSKSVWEIRRDETGAHIIWILIGSSVLLLVLWLYGKSRFGRLKY